MRERPHTLVREAVVVTMLLLGRQPDPSQRVRRLVRRDGDPVVRVDNVRVRVTPAVCDPGPAPFAHQRVERHRHASRRRRYDNRTIVTPHVLVRFAIGHHNEWSSVSTVQGYLRHRGERSKVAARKRITEPDRSSLDRRKFFATSSGSEVRIAGKLKNGRGWQPASTSVGTTHVLLSRP